MRCVSLSGRAGYKARSFMATLEFSKLHGTANDFVYVDARAGVPWDPAMLARRVCDRHRGIGADGLILLLPSERADCRMKIVNSDGSTAEMCGNGIRGFAKFVLDGGLVRANPLRVETDAGVKTVVAELAGGRVDRDADGEVLEHPLEVAGRRYQVTCLSMGNPHCVTFVDDVAGLALSEIGPRFEHHAFFPKRVNTEFIHVASPTRLDMRVWERGAGETLACGTGACAAAVAAARTGRAERRCTVVLPGGELEIEWRADDHVVMTGDAVEVFRGRIEV